MRARIGRIVATTSAIIAGLLVVAQLVPYGRNHTNPPIVDEPPWNRPETRTLAVMACFDCHSNETRWPWYSHIAPASWLVQRHVDEGRAVLNFSQWSRTREGGGDASESVTEGEMPPANYVLLHPSARLTANQRAQLAQGLAILGPGRGAEDQD